LSNTNIIQRTPEDICLLCLINKATQKGSHYTPMSMLASNTGKRGYEFTAIIDPNSETLIHPYFGRSNSKNNDPEIKKDPHIDDFIFCPECEKKLSVLEDLVVPILTTKLKSNSQKSNFPQSKTAQNTSFISCLKNKPSIIALLVYSIIWRQHIQQWIMGGLKVFNDNEGEIIRKALNDNLSDNRKHLIKNDVLLPNIEFVIFTSTEFDNTTKNFVKPMDYLIQPYMFMINEFIVLVDFKKLKPQKNTYYFDLDEYLIDNELINNGKDIIKIGLFNMEQWNKINKESYDILFRIFHHKMVLRFEKESGLPYALSSFLLDKCVNLIIRQPEIHAAECYRICFEGLKKSLI